MVRFNKFLPAAFAAALALAPFAATARANDVPALQAMHVAVNSQGRPGEQHFAANSKGRPGEYQTAANSKGRPGEYQTAENSKGRPGENQFAANSKGRPGEYAPANQEQVG
jgi:hypothetical protein